MLKSYFLVVYKGVCRLHPHAPLIQAIKSLARTTRKIVTYLQHKNNFNLKN